MKLSIARTLRAACRTRALKKSAARAASLGGSHSLAMTAAAVLMAFALAAPPVAHAASSLTPAQLAEQGKERLLVAYKPRGKSAAQSAIAKAGGRIVLDLNEDRAFAVELAIGAKARLQRNPSIEFVEADALRYAYTAQPAAAPAASALAVGQTVPYGIPMVQADQLADTVAFDRTLCIVDSGIDRAHEDLAGIPMDGANLTESGEWFTDESSHGTHVAGTVAAVNNDFGVIGVLPNQRINLFISKVFDASGSASSSTIIQGVRACMRAQADVISMSLGGPRYSRLEARLYDFALSQGILVIAAAGNDGNSEYNYPASYPSVVSVAAIDANSTVASFSQFNDQVELSGPGVGVLSTVPAGSQTEASLEVGETPYAVLPMDGSPRTSASGPLADFGLGDTATPGAMTGMVCLISRGEISFADKVSNCEASGGVGAVIYNNTSGELLGTLGDVVTTIPSVGATQADGATMLGMLGQTADVAVFSSPAQYAEYSGTSMATPHVSGVAALLWSYFPSCTPTQVRDSLDKSAVDLGEPGRDVYYGFGLVQAKAAFDRINTMGCGG